MGATVSSWEQPHPSEGGREGVLGVGRAGPGARTTSREGVQGQVLGQGTHLLELLDLGLLKHRKDVGRASLGLLGGHGLPPGPCLPAGLQDCGWGGVLFRAAPRCPCTPQSLPRRAGVRVLSPPLEAQKPLPCSPIPRTALGGHCPCPTLALTILSQWQPGGRGARSLSYVSALSPAAPNKERRRGQTQTWQPLPGLGEDRAQIPATFQ